MSKVIVTVQYEDKIHKYELDTFVAFGVTSIEERKLSMVTAQMGKFNYPIVKALLQGQMENQAQLLQELMDNSPEDAMRLLFGMQKEAEDAAQKIMKEDYAKGVDF